MPRPPTRDYWMMPFRNSDLAYVMQSGDDAGGAFRVNLHGDGHLASIGARFETRKCPICPEKLPQNCCTRLVLFGRRTRRTGGRGTSNRSSGAALALGRTPALTLVPVVAEAVFL